MVLRQLKKSVQLTIPVSSPCSLTSRLVQVHVSSNPSDVLHQNNLCCLPWLKIFAWTQLSLSASGSSCLTFDLFIQMIQDWQWQLHSYIHVVLILRYIWMWLSRQKGEKDKEFKIANCLARLTATAPHNATYTLHPVHLNYFGILIISLFLFAFKYDASSDQIYNVVFWQQKSLNHETT